MRDLEELKRKVAKEETPEEANKENLNPRLLQSTPRSKPKLKEIYLGFEDKTQELAGPRMALSMISVAKTPKTPSKISQVFGKLFSGKKAKKGPEMITLPTEEQVYLPTV